MKKAVAKIVGLLVFAVSGLTALVGCGDSEPDYSQLDKTLYTPTSVTVSMYDAAGSVYGFTYNTKSEPISAVLQIEEGTTLTDACGEYAAVSEQARSFNDADDTQTSGSRLTYYVSKVEVALKPNTTYTYRLGDKKVGAYTAAATITTNDPSATSFKFAHVSDSQTAKKRESDFGWVLGQIIEDGTDFVVHTGDVVEWPKYEAFWDRMLDGNFAQLSRIPIMAISGNHETTYQSGTNETFKHFNYKLPQQESTNRGLFYSYRYGNAKFIMLNTNDLTSNNLKPEQYDWLINELENNDCAWTIVAIHNPMYSAGVYGSDETRNTVAVGLQNQLKGIFAEYGVDIVLQGHDHLVSRTFPIGADGTPLEEDIREEGGIGYSYDPAAPIYVMNGPATDQTREPYSGYDASLYSYALSSSERSWAEFEVSGNTLTVSAYHLLDDGTAEVYATWGIKKS